MLVLCRAGLGLGLGLVPSVVKKKSIVRHTGIAQDFPKSRDPGSARADGTEGTVWRSRPHG